MTGNTPECTWGAAEWSTSKGSRVIEGMKWWGVGLLLLAFVAVGMDPSRTQPEAAPKPEAAPESLPSGPRPEAPRRSSTAGHVELHVDTTKTFYDVNGTNIRDLREEISRKAPAHDSGVAVGLASWHVRWESDFERSPGGRCHLQNGEVHVSVEITMPRWEGFSSAPAPLQKRWSDCYRALVRHERRYQTLIIKAGRRLRRALDRLQAPSCTALEQKAGRYGRQILKRARTRNERFDEREEFSL